MKHARKVLDEDYYGDLELIKDRILEYLAVRRLNPDTADRSVSSARPASATTSLGKSIAPSPRGATSSGSASAACATRPETWPPPHLLLMPGTIVAPCATRARATPCS